MAFRIGCLFLSLACLVGLEGCGGGKDRTIVVQGTVQYKGKAVVKAQVTFIPLNPESGKLATGETDDEGVFSLTTPQLAKKGAIAGEYKVTVSKKVPKGKAPVAGAEGPVEVEEGALKETLPPHVSDAAKTQLTVTVADGGGPYDLTLPEKPSKAK